MVLLDFIRYHQHLTGTKIGCREGDCGACTVLVGELKDGELKYQSMTCCLMPLGNAQGKHIVTVEGINMNDLNPVQKAMSDEGATQCGFCTPGFVMSLAGFCLSDKTPTPQHAIAAIDGNICRCTGYKSIERAAAKVAALMSQRNGEDITSFVSKNKILPEYFTTIKNKLSLLETNGLTTPDLLRSARNDAGLLTCFAPLAMTQDSELKTPDSRLPTVLGGGTDLYVQKHDEMTHASIRFTFDDPALKNIRQEGNTCVMGASVSVTDMKESEVINKAFPGFQRYAKLVSSTPIRNMATVAGNFINASPIGDFTIFFLALDAQLVLSDGKTTRTLLLRKLYKGYKTLDKRPEEYVEQIRFELPGKNSLFHFEKVSKRTHLDIASVNTAIHLTMDGNTVKSAGISAGGVGPVPMYLQKTADLLSGKTISEQLVYDVIETAQTEISPISDARGTKEYKRLLLSQLIKAHFITLFPQLETANLITVS
jgi:xanthine dehydrogenase small subunit